MSATLSPSEQKSLGAFYTPRPMADKMTRWAVRSPDDRVLDPSFGGLVFLESSLARLEELGATGARARRQLFGADLDALAHERATDPAGLRISADALLHRDFFGLAPAEHLPLVEAVIGNPPYVRYQGWDATGSAAHELALAAGVKLTRLASIWAPFLIHGTAFVAPGGRLAQVLPAELLHAQYAQGVLEFVCERFERVAVVVFDQRVFPGALEEVVLLFADGRGGRPAKRPAVLGCADVAGLKLPKLERALEQSRRSRPRGGTRKRKLLVDLLPPGTARLYDRLGDEHAASRLTALASVDIGAVTGGNEFFLVTADEARKLPPELLEPAVSKAVHVRGARFRKPDHAELAERGTRCFLFVADAETPEALLNRSRAYLRKGVRAGIPRRYKCRVRDPWWAVPLPRHGSPDLYLTYCASEYPRLAVNEAAALHTNTLHGVVMRNGLPPSALAAGFYNSLTLLSAELVGRSYGGGVLKLEPTEAEALLMPPVPPEAADLLEPIDRAIRDGDLVAALDLSDGLLLRDGLGLSEREIKALREGAELLRARRRARGRAPRL